MNPRKATKIFVLAVVVVGIVYDGWAWSTGGTEATISWLMFEAAHKYPMTAFALGVLVGHWYWQMKANKKLKDAEPESTTKVSP